MKRVLISGGSRGIGAACVKKFTGAGYAVAFFYRNRHTLAEALERATGAKAFAMDLSDPVSVAMAARQAMEWLGGVDILVNCGGIAQQKLFTDLTDGDWNTMIATDLSGAFHLSRAVAPRMISQKQGRIINIGSMWGKTGASCEVHYSAAKAGLSGMTKALAKELGPSGITVNCVEPGVIATEMNEALGRSVLEELAAETPLCRLGQPEDVAEAVFFLASEQASFITGQILGVDGGFAV